jgi:hypothetical protein
MILGSVGDAGTGWQKGRMGPPIDNDILVLVRSCIRSVWALELLLLLCNERGCEWTESELVRELRGSPVVVRDSIAALQAAGIVATRSGLARYQPRTPVLADRVDALLRVYESRPTSLMRAIAASPDHRIQIFADAFRFKP